MSLFVTVGTALSEVSAFFDKELESGTPDAGRLEILMMLVDSYEQ